MAYGILSITLLLLAVKGYCGKITSISVKDLTDSFRFNLLRMVFCLLIGAVFVFLEGAEIYLALESKMFWICLLSGVSNVAFLVGWLLAIQKNSMVSVDVSLTLGSIIPAALCAVLFSEKLSLFKMLGFALILCATVILAKHSKSTKGGSFVGMLWLLLATVGDGMSGFAQQLYKQYYTEAGNHTHGVFYPKTVYHLYTYLLASVTLLLLLLICRITQNKKTGGEGKALRAKVPKRVVWHIAIMAICLFAANYLQTVLTNDYGMPSQVLYPIIKGGCLITVNFTAMLFFGERITRRSVLGSLFALSGMIGMSVL